MAALHCLPLTPALLLMLAWRTGDAAGASENWFYWSQKIDWLTMVLRDRWQWFDLGAAAILYLVLLAALARWRQAGFAAPLFLAAALLGAAFLILPRTLLGSNFADMRLAPFALAVALLAIRAPASARAASLTAAAALAFFAARTAGTTASFLQFDRQFDRELAAIDHIPTYARVVSFVGVGCFQGWTLPRTIHLPAMALVRRRAFSNDQWALAGAQLLHVRKSDALGFRSDPSQLVRSPACAGPGALSLDQALRSVPRHAFDHVWLIAPTPLDARLTAGLKPVWSNGHSVLLRIEPAERR
jgi:hypothetical protein